MKENKDRFFCVRGGRDKQQGKKVDLKKLSFSIPKHSKLFKLFFPLARDRRGDKREKYESFLKIEEKRKQRR